MSNVSRPVLSVRRRVLALVVLPGMLWATLLISVKAEAGHTVFIEAVNAYSNQCNPDPLDYAISEATGFRNELTRSGTSLSFFSTSSDDYFDSQVWTSDFIDPQISGQWDQDDLYFDRRGNAFSYFAGHGVGGKGDTCPQCEYSQPCTSSWSCGTGSYQPPAGSQLPGFCRRNPGNNFGWCSYTAYDRAIAVGTCTSGPDAQTRNGRINYSLGNLVKWGESTQSWQSGTWGGAGLTGGTNVVILGISHAQRTNRGHELIAAYAGVHLILTPLIHWGDTDGSYEASQRGYLFALRGTTHPTEAVALSYAIIVNSIPTAAGSGCTDWYQQGIYYSDGHGINGCGGYIGMGLGATQTEANAHKNRPWNAIHADSNDGKGNAAWANWYSCNYDCSTWSFAL